ncbi:hypothetical protein LWH48_11190 [Halomonas sp. G15]|nr:hypothetical protein [Halomonas sp. G15]
MVSIVIGLLIIFSAFQLYILSGSTSRQVELISTRQSFINFYTEVIYQEIQGARLAYPVKCEDEVSVGVDEADNLFILAGDSSSYSDLYCGSDNPLVAIEYFNDLNGSAPALKVSYLCESEWESQGSEPSVCGGERVGLEVAKGVEVRFYQADLSKSVDVSMTIDFPGDAAPLEMMVANREAAKNCIVSEDCSN